MRHQPSELVYEMCGKPYVCAYCGDPSDTIDHAVPRWFVEGNLKLIRRYRLIKVHACRSCNGLAGKVVDETFIHRRRRIARALRRKFRRILNTADWTEDELRELGRNLRTYCSRSNEAARVLHRRLRVLDDPIPPDDVPNVLFDKQTVVEMAPELRRVPLRPRAAPVRPVPIAFSAGLVGATQLSLFAHTGAV